MPSIEVSGLRKAFGSRTVLDNVSFTVESGSMVAVAGPSGSGKTTLLNCIGLLDTYDDGTIIVNGKDLARMKRGDRTRYFRHDVGYLFQNYALIDEETVDGNLDIACAYVSRGEGTKKDWKLHALAEVGLADKLSARVFELSGGEQQRVAVARLLIRQPKVILADEPTGALDGANRDIIMKLLRTMRDDGAAIVVVTHDPNVVAECDDQIRMADY
ncbi:ABC transporter ATP-binding protein [Nocardia salmonicida]|uniref:ABC transporter ATP-binding protein n=1 Tax=Nocardia salmonicida TaxID=53431 RepID=UPI0033FF4AB5